ncbi:MAG: transcriptional regulator [Nitrososphaerota archaeon]|nr:transcriptional regulator [Nitrososphaerota archaeon]
MYKQEGIRKKHLATLEKIKENLEKLNEKIDVLIELRKVNEKELQKFPDSSLDVITLLNLPDHLRKTAVAICRNGRATAEEIADQTNRARAMESSYLNQLVIMGYLKKQRKGKKTCFYVERGNES